MANPRPDLPGWTGLPAAVPPDAPLWLGFSGGEDSLLLAHLLAERFPARLRLLHVHHRQIPEDDAIARACETLARGAGWRLTVVESPVDPTDTRTFGPEAAARHARRRALAAHLPPGAVHVTAHHRRDQAETLLLRALRGTGPAGLAGMAACQPLDPPAHGWRWRPLLGVPKTWIKAEAARRGLASVPDPLHDDPRLARARLRQTLWPALETGWPDPEGALARLSLLARAETDLLAAYVAADLAPRLVGSENYPPEKRSNEQPAETAPTPSGDPAPRSLPTLPQPAGPGLSLAGWDALAPARRAALARAWLAGQGVASPPADWLARLDAEVARAAPSRHPVLVLNGLSVKRYKRALWAFLRR